MENFNFISTVDWPDNIPDVEEFIQLFKTYKTYKKYSLPEQASNTVTMASALKENLISSSDDLIKLQREESSVQQQGNGCQIKRCEII